MNFHASSHCFRVSTGVFILPCPTTLVKRNYRYISCNLDTINEIYLSSCEVNTVKFIRNNTINIS